MLNFARWVVVAGLLLSARSGHASLILNGDFESNSASSTLFNLSNADFNATVAHATAFGTSEEIDLVTGTDFGISPQSGNWKLGLHERTSAVGNFDGFSLDLSSSIVTGMTYDLRFFGVGLLGDPLTPIQIGLSNSATSFGTLLFSGMPTSTTAWTQFDFSFTAAFGATFLTVRNDPSVFDGYAFVDNITLVKRGAAAPEPSSLLLLGSALTAWAGVAWRRERRR